MTETPETPAPRPTAAEKRAAAQAAAKAKAESATPTETAAATTPVAAAVPPAETPAVAPVSITPAATTPASTTPASTTPVVETAAAAATTAAPTAATPTGTVPPAFAQPTATAAAPRSGQRFPVGVVAAVVVAALVGGVSGAGVSLWAVSMNQSPASESSAPTTVTVNDPDNATNATAVAVKASASVVTISVSSGQTGGSGSGVILNTDGYILTNTHVVTLEGAVSNPDITVTTDSGQLFTAEIIGTDPIADLAVIKIKASDDLVPMEFADSDALNVGDAAIAIGAPLGLSGTVTDGIISSLNRSIQIASSAAPTESDESGDSGDNGDDNGDDSQSPFDFWQFDVPGQDDTTTPSASSATISLPVIQTDAAINPGNSGGALLDSEGKLIGINVAIASAGSTSGQGGSIGVGFAIPANFADRIAQEIIKDGSATHGLLGASVLDVTEDTSVSDSATVGAIIKEITADGAAEAAGLKVGDVVTKVDDVRITGKTDLTAQVRAHAAGATVTLTYVRNGKTAEVSVTLGTLKA